LSFDIFGRANPIDEQLQRTISTACFAKFFFEPRAPQESLLRAIRRRNFSCLGFHSQLQWLDENSVLFAPLCSSVALLLFVSVVPFLATAESDCAISNSDNAVYGALSFALTHTFSTRRS